MSWLALPDSFEYLCYRSTASINIFYSYSAGINFSCQNLTSTDVGMTEVDPRTVRVNLFSAGTIFRCQILMSKDDSCTEKIKHF